MSSSLFFALLRVHARLRTKELYHLAGCHENLLLKAKEYSHPPSSTPSCWLMCHSDQTHSHEGSGTCAVCMLVGDGLWKALAAIVSYAQLHVLVSYSMVLGRAPQERQRRTLVCHKAIHPVRSRIKCRLRSLAGLRASSV